MFSRRLQSISSANYFCRIFCTLIINIIACTFSYITVPSCPLDTHHMFFVPIHTNANKIGCICLYETQHLRKRANCILRRIRGVTPPDVAWEPYRGKMRMALCNYNLAFVLLIVFLNFRCNNMLSDDEIG